MRTRSTKKRGTGTYREGLVDDNGITKDSAKESAGVPVGAGLVVEGEPVWEIEAGADQHGNVAQPPGELWSLRNKSMGAPFRSRWSARCIILHPSCRLLLC